MSPSAQTWQQREASDAELAPLHPKSAIAYEFALVDDSLPDIPLEVEDYNSLYDDHSSDAGQRIAVISEGGLDGALRRAERRGARYW